MAAVNVALIVVALFAGIFIGRSAKGARRYEAGVRSQRAAEANARGDTTALLALLNGRRDSRFVARDVKPSLNEAYRP